MAKFTDIKYEALGIFIRNAITDPKILETLKNGSQADKRQLLSEFMVPLDKKWDDLIIHAHFDEENVVNIAFPFTGDVEKTVDEISPPSGPGKAYLFPDHYTMKPNDGATDADKNANRLRAYHSRLGDYVMSRCK
jgi:hypothetical protein